MTNLRSAPGMRERAPEVWELVVQAGRDPVTGRPRQVSRTFRGNLRDAKKARAELIVEVTKGRHTGSCATVDDLFADWIVELQRKGRSPNTVDGYEKVYRRNIQPTLGTRPVTKVTIKVLTDLYGAHSVTDRSRSRTSSMALRRNSAVYFDGRAMTTVSYPRSLPATE